MEFKFLAARFCAMGVAAVLMAGASRGAEKGGHWAFEAPVLRAPPAVKNGGWAQTDLDRFILAKLEAAGIEPAPAADGRTLIRRMTYDVTGLAPTREETADFLAEEARDRAGAIGRLIERLLASPRYGEQWGRHWLDLARYSDTKGYVYAREEARFVHAATYRDWVVRAFNSDMAYDRFLLLQLAADQLVGADSPDLAAMGFITGGRRFLGVTHDIIDDRIDVVTRGTMALTVACARCHDHKYDPIPTRDYYSLYGVFHGSDDRLVELSRENDAELKKRREKLAETMAKRREEAAERLRARAGEYLAAQLELAKYPEEGFDQILGAEDTIPASVRRWRDWLETTRDPKDRIFGPWHRLAGLGGEEFARAAGGLAKAELNPMVAEAFEAPPANMREVAQRYGECFTRAEKDPEREGAAELRRFLRDPESPTVVPDSGIVSNEGFFPTSQLEDLWRLQGEVDRRLLELGARAALIAAERPPEPDPRVFKRGSASQPGEAVPRRFLEVLAGPGRKPFTNGNGRLELAREIACAKNPLTARVMANRIWQHHFGSGLVRTPSDFGLRAEPPTHPELLDWLALRLVAEGWSVKGLHRLILASAVYQTAGEPRMAGDPDNRLLAHFPEQRLTFEELRDSMLEATGELDGRMGGRASSLLEGSNRRRTIYAQVDRQFLPGVFRTFDFANPDIHVAVRHETTVPQQALYFLNGTFAADRARGLAAAAGGGPPAERVQGMYFRLFQRPATDREVSAALRFVAGARSGPEVPERKAPSAWQYGTGEYDAKSGRVKGFKALAYFNGTAWQGAEALPGGEPGWAHLTAEGGHPGNTRAFGCVRRWTAARDGAIRISGRLTHEPEAGDGVRAFIVSGRQGELRGAKAHHASVDLALERVEVKAGETIDFVVDIGEELNSDQFFWAPRIEEGGTVWDARADFGGNTPAPDYLTPWEQYAQVLLLSNEFAFVD